LKGVKEEHMLKLLKLLPVNLKLFDGEGGGGDAGGATAGGIEASQSTATDTKGGKPVVVYGKQADVQTAGQETVQDATGQQQQKTPEQLRTEYEAWRKGEYKQFFDADVQNIINKRFRETKTLESQLAAMSPIIDLLTEKYGTEDIAQLSALVRQDSIEDMADAAGMTVEEYEKVMKIRQENRMLKQKQQTWEAEQRINQQVQQWNQEAMALKAKYPDFDLAAEAQNPQFLDLLKAGVTVEAAYQVIHMDEIIAGTAKQAQQNLAENIKAKGNRPQESAAKGTQGVIIKSDPSKLTAEDRAEIARRVMMGEEITF
jgi:hypothetical protein